MDSKESTALALLVHIRYRDVLRPAAGIYVEMVLAHHY